MRRKGYSKYRAKKIDTPDGKFDSQGEYRRWRDLQLMFHGGLIGNLERQVRFPLEVNGEKICDYIMDFTYRDPSTNTWVAEDFKGYQTSENKLKVRLFKAVYEDKWEFRMTGRGS
jgi:hypothetical protein